MDAIEALKTRRSVRKFEEKGLPREALEEMVDCARLAPTARNIQPCRFVVVTDRAKLERLGKIADHGRFLRDAAACIAVFSEETKYYLEDGSAATQNILLAAHALGIASCWVAGDKKAYAPEVMKTLGASGNFRLVSLVALGYSAESAPGTPKKDLEEVISWGKF